MTPEKIRLVDKEIPPELGTQSKYEADGRARGPLLVKSSARRIGNSTYSYEVPAGFGWILVQDKRPERVARSYGEILMAVEQKGLRSVRAELGF